MNERYSIDGVDEIAQKLLTEIATGHVATVVGLSGDLGAGKTTLVQSIARTLGVDTPVVSPTFVIAKFYPAQHSLWDTLVHIDAYRIDDVSELDPIGWDTLIATPRTLVVVEWPERIEQRLPSTTQRFTIEHNDTERHITTL